MGIGSTAAARIVAWQLALTLFAAVVCSLVWDFRAGWSAGFGGGISTFATAYFAWYLFSRKADRSPQAVMRAFFIGEAQKLGLTALLFVIAIKWMDVSFPPLFVTYIATLLVYWLVLPFSLDGRTGSAE